MTSAAPVHALKSKRFGFSFFAITEQLWFVADYSELDIDRVGIFLPDVIDEDLVVREHLAASLRTFPAGVDKRHSMPSSPHIIGVSNSGRAPGSGSRCRRSPASPSA